MSNQAYDTTQQEKTGSDTKCRYLLRMLSIFQIQIYVATLCRKVGLTWPLGEETLAYMYNHLNSQQDKPVYIYVPYILTQTEGHC